MYPYNVVLPTILVNIVSLTVVHLISIYSSTFQYPLCSGLITLLIEWLLIDIIIIIIIIIITIIITIITIIAVMATSEVLHPNDEGCHGNVQGLF